jgi:hypothetical protein
LSRKARCNCLMVKPENTTHCDDFRRLGTQYGLRGFSC